MSDNKQETLSKLPKIVSVSGVILDIPATQRALVEWTGEAVKAREAVANVPKSNRQRGVIAGVAPYLWALLANVLPSLQDVKQRTAVWDKARKALVANLLATFPEKSPARRTASTLLSQIASVMASPVTGPTIGAAWGRGEYGDGLTLSAGLTAIREHRKANPETPHAEDLTALIQRRAEASGNPEAFISKLREVLDTVLQNIVTARKVEEITSAAPVAKSAKVPAPVAQ